MSLLFHLEDGTTRAVRLPFGLNGKLDHILKLPFVPRHISAVAHAELPEPVEFRVDFHKIGALTAKGFMAERCLRFLRKEGTWAQLSCCDSMSLSREDVVLSSASTWLERTYRNIKLRMIWRSVPLACYSQWKDAHADRLCPAPSAQAASGCPMAVIVLAGAKAGRRQVASTLRSLLDQTVPIAQLIVVLPPGGAGGGAFAEELQGFPNALLLDRDEGLGAAVAEVSASHFAVIEAGEVLAPSAACLIGRELNEAPNAVFVSWDEEYRVSGALYPLLKPSYDPILQAHSNYLGHGCLYSTRWARTIPGRDDQIGDAPSLQAHLRGVDGALMRHLPYILLGSGEERRDFSPPGGSTDSRMLFESPMVSIIIPTRDCLHLLEPCIRSIARKTEYPAYEIVVLDNGSCDLDAVEYLQELGRNEGTRVLVVDEPFNYSRLNNLAVASSKGSVLAFLNNDVEIISPDWLSELVGLACMEGVGAVGARLLYPDGTIQHAGVALGIGLAGHPWKGAHPADPRLAIHVDRTKTVSANTGACLVVRREHFEAVGGFDESLAVAFNDVDLCLKLQDLRLRNVWTPKATLVHHESVSRGRPDTPESRAQFEMEKRIMRGRWGERLKNDPYYNPNLTCEVEDGALALFPRHLYVKKRWQS